MNLYKLYYMLPPGVQTLGINLYEFNEWKLRRNKKFNKWLNILLDSERWDKEELDAYQNKNLKAIVNYAYKHVPFYHNLYNELDIDISKIKCSEDLELLPIISKDDILRSSGLYDTKTMERFVIRYTSGTTGSPLKVKISESSDVLIKANAFRRDLWAGYKGDLIARFVGDKPVRNCNGKSLYRKSYIMNRCIFPSYCLSMDTLPNIINTLKKLKIEMLQCYPSTAYIIAKYLQINDEYLPLNALLYSSEPIDNFSRELIEDRFQTKIFGFYGQAEGVISAIECEKGEYHLTMLDGILEIIKNEERVYSGEKGFTIGTSLHNYAMPLIRYALNDYTGYIDYDMNTDSLCGRTLPRIYPIETKLEDFIVTSSGRFFTPPSIMALMKNRQNIIESQIIQKDIDFVLIRLVVSETYNDLDEMHLKESFIRLFGEQVSIQVEYVSSIHPSASFKKQRVKSELGREYIENLFQNNSQI